MNTTSNFPFSVSYSSFRWESKGRRSYFIHVQHPTPKNSAKGSVLILHGMAEHGGTFEELGRTLAEDGISVWAPDRLGHGKTVENEEDKVTCEGVSCAEEESDMMDLIEHIRRESGTNVPLLVYGHSAGGILALSLATSEREEKAFPPIILSGFPGLLSKSLLNVAQWWYRNGGPSSSEDKRRSNAKLFNFVSVKQYEKAFPNDGKDGWISSNKKGREEYTADSMCDAPVKAEFALRYMEQMRKILNNIDKLALKSIGCVYGLEDPCSGKGKSVMKLEKVLSKHGHHLAFSLGLNGRHALHREGPEVIEILSQTIEMMLERE